MKLTDEQVVRVLALRNGFTEVYDWKPGYGTLNDRICHVCIPPYLASSDALAPVLAGLSDGEWSRLHVLLNDNAWEDHTGVVKTDRFRAFFLTKWMLTLPPADLARAVAEAISK